MTNNKMNPVDFCVEEVTIEEVHQAMVRGEVTSQELILAYLRRIADFDQSGPGINSVLEINPDALQIAEGLDCELESSGPRGPLHGIPILIKDNIDTKDKMHTSAGSLALADSYALNDAFLVKKLRAAGAVILGKTNLTEFANFMAEGMPNGYSSRGGQVLNPYDLSGKHDPGGSSAGSGAAVAANFCTTAIGTETSGSILSPSCQNGIVGIKPTVGLISRSGIIPISTSQDTAGPMARTVKDAAIVLGALVGMDENDPATFTSVGRVYDDYTQFLDHNGLNGARIGITRKFYEKLSENELKVAEEAIKTLRKLGAIVIDPVIIESEFKSIDVLYYEFKSGINAYLHNLGSQAPVHSLKDIITFNARHSEQGLKYGQKVLLDAEKTSGRLTEPEYLRARIEDIADSRQNGIDAVMTEHSLDALVFPMYWGCWIGAKAGYPSITVPAGFTEDGLPFGITFTARAYCEPTLLKLAYGYEQGTLKRRPPKWNGGL